MGVVFSYALLAGLATALIVAAVTDLRSRTIANRLNLAIALAAPLYWLAVGYGWVDIVFMLAQTALTFVFCVALFAARQMGGGDVKLLTALALWFPPLAFFELVFMMAVLGGGASVAMALANMQRRPGETVRDAIGALATLLWVSMAAMIAVSLMTGRPVFGDPAVLVGALVKNTALLVAAAALILGVTVFGLFHVVRRQKGKLRVPYGVAISAGGLWILGEQAVSTARFGANLG